MFGSASASPSGLRSSRTEHPQPQQLKGWARTNRRSGPSQVAKVIIHVDTELGPKDLLNSRMAYVAVSRGQYDAQIFTSDREKLPAALGHDVSLQSAHSPERKPPQRELAETPKQEKSQGMDIGLSL